MSEIKNVSTLVTLAGITNLLIKVVYPIHPSPIVTIVFGKMISVIPWLLKNARLPISTTVQFIESITTVG